MYFTRDQIPIRIIAFMALLIAGSFNINGQQINIEKLSLSTRSYDEFSPVFFDDGLVFCTNRRTNSLLGYSNNDTRLCKLFYSGSLPGKRWNGPVLFSTELTTTFNEGPATFNKEGTLIYFTRNNTTTGRFSNVEDLSNKLGIYSAQFKNGTWQDIRPFIHNNPLYTFATPALSSDGERLYFSTDMPGGYGGMDIYYSEKCDAEWCKPVNAGPNINTSGNETYPYIDSEGKLYFSSDGHPGKGGKDIFYSFERDGTWIKPVAADTLNSSANDYGIIVDSTGLNGFFTSDRLLSDDIFRFTTVLPQFADCDTFNEPTYCFTIYDERYIPNDTLILHYKWDFGDGIIKYGPQVNYCFPGPGEYKIMLDITDEITGDTVAWQVPYDVTLDPPSQLFLNAPNISIADRPIEFNTYGSLINGADIIDYSWDFGDGFISGISKIERKFKRTGTVAVTAGMSNHNGKQCVTKNFTILESLREFRREKSANGTLVSILGDEHVSENVISRLENINEKLQITIDQNGIQPGTEKLLDQLISLCKEAGLHLELQVYNKDDPDKSVMDSRELSFYLRNHLPGKNYGVQTVDSRQILTGNTDSAACIYEFILVKK